MNHDPIDREEEPLSEEPTQTDVPDASPPIFRTWKEWLKASEETHGDRFQVRGGRGAVPHNPARPSRGSTHD